MLKVDVQAVTMASLTNKIAPGYRIRIQGLLGALERAGLQIESNELKAGPLGSVEMLSYLSNFNRRIVKGILANSQGHVVFFGLQTAAILCLIPKRYFKKSKIVVDVCDSWAKLSKIGSKRNLHKSFVKLCLVRSIYRLLAKKVETFSFISDTDRAEDELFIKGNPSITVVPNGVPAWCKNKFFAGKGDPRVLLFVGSGLYPPNQEALVNGLELLRSEMHSTDLRIRVVGEGWPIENKGPVEYLGWVDNLEQEYESAGATLALLQSGAGVSNKVVESLAVGRPVFASEMIFEQFGGIPGVHLANTSTIADLLNRLSNDSLQSPEPDWGFPDWQDSARRLVGYEE